MRPGILCLALSFAAAGASAERPVYRNVDAGGRVTYSDRGNAESDRVQQWTPASPGSDEYYSARARAESDERYYRQQQYEERQPRPILIYDPRGWAAQRPPALPSTRWYDPNLPSSQPPSLERRYYYDGR
jgi:hypothetical protein